MNKKITAKLLCVLLAVALTVCALPCAAFAADSAPYRISVTVNGDAGASRGFCWYTADKAESYVRIYAGGARVTGLVSKAADVTEFQGAYLHKVTVSGLTAGMTYTYSVGSDAGWSDEGSFRTDDGDGSFSFVTVSDMQASSLENYQKAAKTLAAALDTQSDAEFVVNCGDFTNDSNNDQWSWFFDATKSSDMAKTLVPVTGNHDSPNGWFSNMFDLDESRSVETANGVNYSFDYGNAHFAVLNTNDCVSISEAQLTWLKNDLNSTAKDWKIVLMHKSLYTLGKDGKWPDAYYIGTQVKKIFDECNVDMVFSGHDHMYLRTKQLRGDKVAEGGTTYVLTGTAGTKRYEIRSFLAGEFLDTNDIASLHIQKSGYGNYWNGTDWNSKDDSNIGGCFTGVTIDGGTLTLNAYILGDDSGVVTNIDSLTLNKQTGENKATYTGANETSPIIYAQSVLPSFIKLAVCAFTQWLPKFMKILPKIVEVYKTEGTF